MTNTTKEGLEEHNVNNCNIGLKALDWVDRIEYIELYAPEEFNFKECMIYLGRSNLECLHRIKEDDLYKLIKLRGKLILMKVSAFERNIRVDFLNGTPGKEIRKQAAEYVWNLFDLSTDISKFYEAVSDDSILGDLTGKYYGLRIVKINSLFEGLCWAIIGQQINLKFAYLLKKRLVEYYGEKLNFNNQDYWVFPEPEVIAKLNAEDLKELQFTSRKAEYIIGIAKLFVEGELVEENLSQMENYQEMLKRLISIKGVGSWTADYVIMKCSRMNCAFPIADVGIHNALKKVLMLDRKPTIAEITGFMANWTGWESYAAFYLWRALYD